MIRRVRLATGLVLLAYVTMHLLNHAAGLISPAAMERSLGWVIGLWGLPPLQALLYGSALAHWSLGLWSLWERRSLRMGPPEFAQLALGMAIPILLIAHVVDARLSAGLFGTDIGYYAYFLWVYFVSDPSRGIRQMMTLVIAWAHAQIGLHFWLRSKPWYEHLQPTLLVLAILVPVLALLGMISGGRAVALLAAEPGWAARAFAAMRLPTPEQRAFLIEVGRGLRWFFVGCIAAVLVARMLRRVWQRRHGVVRLSYPDGRSIEVARGTSVLEASRLAGVPHASVCGGRGRCSTCRVRIRAEFQAVEPPGSEEARVLRRIRATPNIRLACMLRPQGAIEVTPLLPPFAVARDARRAVDVTQGSEREIAILFADIRGFTTIAEGRLPYDVVFVLNRYFAAMGRAVEAAGGRVDKFIGDGVMALFGIERGAEAGCREALAAARLMSERLAELNLSLEHELDAPLRIGIGIHAGAIILGEMGYGAATNLTAIGDAVNTASRLESMTKEFGCEVVVSEAVIERAGLDLSAFPQYEVEIRGKREMLAVRAIASGQDLTPSLAPGRAGRLRVGAA